MKKHLFFLFALFLALLGPAVAADLPSVGEKAQVTLFSKSIEDLPIMRGFSVVEDKDLIFVFGQDRIAQTTLRGNVDVDSVYYFYREVLPSLGWKYVNMKLYRRGKEELHMDVSSANKNGVTFVTFEVKPLKN